MMRMRASTMEALGVSDDMTHPPLWWPLLLTDSAVGALGIDAGGWILKEDVDVHSL